MVKSIGESLMSSVITVESANFKSFFYFYKDSTVQCTSLYSCNSKISKVERSCLFLKTFFHYKREKLKKLCSNYDQIGFNRTVKSV